MRDIEFNPTYGIKATQTDWHNDESYLCDTVMFQRWNIEKKNAAKLYLSEAEKILWQLKHDQKVSHSNMPWGCGKLKAVHFEIIKLD